MDEAERRLAEALSVMGYKKQQSGAWERRHPLSLWLALNPRQKVAVITPALTAEGEQTRLSLKLKVKHQTDWYTKADVEYFSDELTDIAGFVETQTWSPFDRKCQGSAAAGVHWVLSALTAIPGIILFVWLVFAERMEFIQASLVFILAYVACYLLMPFIPVKSVRKPLSSRPAQ